MTMLRKIILGAILSVLSMVPTLGQSLPPWPITTYGYVATPAQWGQAFQLKQDYLGSAPCVVTGCIFTGPITLAPSTATIAGLNIAPGVAPTSPNNGDTWVTSAGLFVRINGVTVGPLVGPGGGVLTAGSTATSGYTSGQILGSTGSVLSVYAVSGSGNVALTTSPVFTTPSLGAATGTSIALGGCSIASGNFCAGQTNITTGASPAFAVGSNGFTNPVLSVNQTGTQATGISITGNTAAGGVAIAAISSATNESLTIDAKGTGSIALGANSSGLIFLEHSVQFGVSGSIVGSFTVVNATSGSISLVPPTGALGNQTLTWPDATDTLVARATTDTLTNKTLTSPTLTNPTVTGSLTATGLVTYADIITGSSDTALGYWGSTVASALPVNNCAAALTYSTSSHAFGCNSTAGTGTVTGGGGGIVPTTGGPTTLFQEQGNPGGRLTLASGVNVMTADQAGATSIWYAPYSGKYVPVYDGTNMEMRVFTSSDADTIGQVIALGSNWAASTLFDVFEGDNSGSFVLCTGPAYTTSSAGAGARSAALALFKGYQTNAASMTCRTSNSTTFTCAINQCTYLGTFLTNGSTGQIDFKFGSAASGGGPAVAGVWNMYNQVPGRFAVQDSKASWTCAVGPGPTDASTTNRITAVNGFPTSPIDAFYQERTDGTTGNFVQLFIGVNSTSVPATKGVLGLMVGTVATVSAVLDDYPPAIGLNFYQALENASTTLTCEGNAASELLKATWWW